MPDIRWSDVYGPGNILVQAHANLPGACFAQLSRRGDLWQLTLTCWPAPTARTTPFATMFGGHTDPDGAPDWNAAKLSAALHLYYWAAGIDAIKGLAHGASRLIASCQCPSGTDAPAPGKPEEPGFLRACYDRYRLDWMAAHDCSPDGLVAAFCEHLKDAADPDDPEEIAALIGNPEAVAEEFRRWELDRGFSGSIWASFDEFLDAEFKDDAYMASILTRDGYLSYLSRASAEDGA